MRTPRAIVFDAFGTLIRYTIRLSPYRRLLNDSRRPLERHAFLTQDVPLATLAMAAGMGSEMDSLASDLAKELQGLCLFSEAPSVLTKARAAGLRLAVCSNLAREYGPTVRRLVPELDAYVFSYEVGVAKPHPTMYRIACAELRCNPAETVFVGDSKRCDYRGPRAFGMDARWLDRKGGQSLTDVLEGVI